MSVKPRIFVSAVSKELGSARELVARNLEFLGYEPVRQEIFGTEQGDLCDMLRGKIDDCEGLIQLAGQRFGLGFTDPENDEQFVSYTQFEMQYARQRNKKVWLVLLDDDFPADIPNDESEDHRKLQQAYRHRLAFGDDLYATAADPAALKILVLELRQPLEELRQKHRAEAQAARRRTTRFRALVGVALTLLVCLALWLVGERAEMADALSALVGRLNAAKSAGQRIDDTTHGLLVTDVEQQYRLADGTLMDYARRVASDGTATPYERAEGAYAVRDYVEAGRFALEAADEAKKTLPLDRSAVIRALMLAGWSALEHGDYAPGLRYMTEASSLADKTRDPVEWGRVNWALAVALDDRGEYAEAEAILRNVDPLFTMHLGPKEPETLASRNNLISALSGQGKYAEAEALSRLLLETLVGVAGPEDPRTLLSQHNLAIALDGQGKHEESEKEHQAVLKIRERVLGPEHPDTLESRNRVTILALSRDGRHAEAEEEFRAVLKIRERVFGPEHRDTLDSRINVAIELSLQRKWEEAVGEHRTVLEIRERVLGVEHPDTLESRHNLATTLHDQGSYAEAESEYRAVIKLRTRVLSPGHPSTLGSRITLARALARQGKLGEAEEQLRIVVEIRVRLLGDEDHETLLTFFHLAQNLNEQDKLADAREFARRAVEGARKVLPPTDADRRRYERLYKQLTLGR